MLWKLFVTGCSKLSLLEQRRRTYSLCRKKNNQRRDSGILFESARSQRTQTREVLLLFTEPHKKKNIHKYMLKEYLADPLKFIPLVML